MDSQTTVSLTPYKLSRPNKIRWDFPVIDQNIPIIEYIQSAKLKKYLHKAEELLTQFDITYVFQEMNESEFLQWYGHYQHHQQDHGYRTVARPEWYQEKLAEQRTVRSLFFYQGSRLIGTKVFTVLEEQITGAYKTTVKNIDFSKKLPFGAVVDYIYITQLAAEGFSHISFGATANSFGVENKVGILEYKLRFGMIPSPARTKLEMLDYVPLNENELVYFFAVNEAQALSLYCLISKNSEHEIIQPHAYPVQVVNL